jgi:hypothetical protein
MERPCRFSAAQILFALAFVTMTELPVLAQPCKASDPNCKILMTKPDMDWSTPSLPPGYSPSGDLSFGTERRATLGAITFRGNGVVCMGLLRRGGCN